MIALSRRYILKRMGESPNTAKRRSQRERAQITVTLVIEGDEADEVATAADLSRHGMRLQTGLSLSPGQRVGLMFGDSPSLVIGARVVWLGKNDSQPLGEAGLEFAKPLEGSV